MPIPHADLPLLDVVDDASRYYIQCDADDKVENWSDDAFWDEFRLRPPPDMAEAWNGPFHRKEYRTIAQFVAEPMRLAVDACRRRGACCAADRGQGGSPPLISIICMTQFSLS